jgi:hypothetical protein
MRNTLVTWATCAVVFTTSPALGQQTTAGAVGETRHAVEKTAASDKLAFAGEAALFTVAIRPDKTADFERVLARLREALLASDNPERRQQAQGWTVLRLTTPLPDGNVAYVHDLRPVVPGADYSIMRIYDAFPDERQALYELYRGAFVRGVALATGRVTMDVRGVTPSLTGTSSVAASAAAPASPPTASPAPVDPQLPAR